MKNNEWKYYRLDEIGTIITGKTPYTKVSDNFGYTYQFITPRDMDVTKYIIKTERYLSKKGLESVSRNVVNENSVCVSCIGSDMGKVVMTKEKAVTNQQINSITNIKENFIPDFIYYSLKPMKDFFHSIAGGTTMPIINKSQFSSIEIKIPAIEIQQKISNILSIIDSKIEINNQINEKLEETAKALYKEWFVNFNFPDENGLPYKDNGGEFVDSELGKIPVNWKIKKLGELTIKFTTGLNPRNNFVLGKGNNYYVTIKNMNNNSIILDDKCDRIDDEALRIINKRSQLNVGDILFSGIGTIGRVYYVDKRPTNWNISESIFVIRPNHLISSELLYLIMLSDDLQNYAQQLASGSVQKGIRMKDLKEYKVIVPDNEFIKYFSSILLIIIKQQKALEYENSKLKEILRSLLSKLMSGQIDVDKLNIDWDKLDKTLKEVENLV